MILKSFLLLSVLPWCTYVVLHYPPSKSLPLLLLLLLVSFVSVTKKITKMHYVFYFVGLVILIFKFGLLSPKVFEYSNNQFQAMSGRIYQYPNVPLARIFQNRLRLSLERPGQNLLNLLDPNYYFFSSHPREIQGQDNYAKVSFLLFPLLLLGSWSSNKTHHREFKLFLGAIFISSLSLDYQMVSLLILPSVIKLAYRGFSSIPNSFISSAYLVVGFPILVWEVVRALILVL